MSDANDGKKHPATAVWPDSFASLQAAYAELVQNQWELERRSEQIAAARDLFDRVIETLNEALFVADPSGHITRVNRAALELIFRSEEDVIGRPLAEFWEDSTLPMTPSLILARNPTGRFGPIAAGLREENGACIPVSLSCAIVRDPNGKITGVLVVARDMRETRQLEQQLVQSGKLAAVGELAAGIAHELNQPLQIIRGFAEMISMCYPAGQSVDELLLDDVRKILEGTDRMMRIINHLRVFARQSAREHVPIHLNEVVEDALLFVEQQMRNHNIDVVSQLDSNLPRVKADPHEIEQVLLNLFSNARDAMPGGGSLTIRTETRGAGVVLSVEDTGTGIPNEILARIFEPFFTTKKAGQGTGLGLSISYSIIKKHGGELRVESGTDRGARFTVTFPMIERAEQENRE
jgi:two-component system NtrC family sensor kinase